MPTGWLKAGIIKTFGSCLLLRKYPNSPMGWLLVDAMMEYPIHSRDIADIPSRDVIVKGGLVLEGVGHIRNRRNIPVADMAIGSEGGGFVGAPQVDRGLEVCVGEDRRVECEPSSRKASSGLEEKDEWIRPLLPLDRADVR